MGGWLKRNNFVSWPVEQSEGIPVIHFQNRVLFVGLILVALSVFLPSGLRAATTITMQKEGGVYTMPCKVNGLQLRFIIDTGASDVSISATEALFMLKNGYLDQSDFIGEQSYRTADGKTHKGKVLILREMEVGGVMLRNVRAGMSENLEAPLLLGQSALQKLGAVSFDYAAGTVTFGGGTGGASASAASTAKSVKPGVASTAKQAKLAQVFDPEMIGADVAYFEQVTGPAWQTYGDTKYYKVDGCEVTATIAGGSIRSLGMRNLSSQCTFNLDKFLPNFAGKLPSPHSMTFGEFDSATGMSGQFYADCLGNCGNASDPVVYEHWYGSRADQNLEVVLGVVLVGDGIAASMTWEDAMEKVEGRYWIIDKQFNYTRKYDAVAHQAFQNVRISKITIGYDLLSWLCTSMYAPLDRQNCGRL